MPVELGGLSTRLAGNEMNDVPRRRSLRTWAVRRLGGLAVGPKGISGSPTAEPLNRPTAFLATACPTALWADQATRLRSSFRSTFWASRCTGRLCRGLGAYSHTPEYN